MDPYKILEASMRLKGKLLQKQENDYSGGYSGSSYFEKTIKIYLYNDHSFLYEESAFSSVSAGGLSIPSQKKLQEKGTWKVEAPGEVLHLVLRDQNGRVFHQWPIRNGGSGVEYMGGIAWNRFRMKTP